MTANGRRQNPRQQPAVGPADRQRRYEFSGQVPENRRIRELQFMVPEFVARTGGSKWLSARPTGSSRVQAQPARVGSADP